MASQKQYGGIEFDTATEAQFAKTIDGRDKRIAELEAALREAREDIAAGFPQTAIKAIDRALVSSLAR